MTICLHCRWCVPIAMEGYYCGIDGGYTVDPVTGDKRITNAVRCYEKNDGACKDYAPRFPWMFIGKVKEREP